MAAKTTLTEFESVFPKLEADLLEWAKGYKLPQQQLDWYKKVSPHTVQQNLTLPSLSSR